MLFDAKKGVKGAAQPALQNLSCFFGGVGIRHYVPSR